MSEIATQCTYFARPGPANTTRTLELARARAEALGIRHVLVATTTGATGVQAAREFTGLELIVVTHSASFREPDTQELAVEKRSTMLAAGAKVLTCQHAFGGVGRAVRKKLGTYELDEIIAFALRTLARASRS
jgi:hypothetical protein